MKDPAFLFYPNDYLGGTLGMTFEEKGAYIELLMVQFNRGHMTIHMVGQILGQSMDKIWSTIQSKFSIDENGLYFNERLEQEQNKRKAYSESRKNNINGINQHTKDKNKSGHKTKHMTSHMENENENINKDLIKYNEFLSKFNAITKSRYTGCKKSRGHFNSRLKEKYSMLDFEIAINNAMQNDKLDKKYLTPEYILRDDKLQLWLNAKSQDEKNTERQYQKLPSLKNPPIK
jgi:uncharacterized protein YdaU (DUF1376 family)